ncbi:protein kinase domain-containing protein [Solirubrobacter soli]|uniref:protein kinase domain-containing protein n=1 Tax=Solirubrobacter soli TaxID=363832 RepID=UPI00041E3218|nr:protein kinase [Solirubrobacter soli]
MSTLVGMQLSGRYRLDAQIGAGGMSTVYKAFDVNLERRVAIKLLHREMSADSDQLERFRREARAVAQLSHPHIVGVIDAGEDENRPYIVFEYVEGETLKDRIRRLGRLPVDEALAYAIEIARALGCAHSHDIVHRDVKPQNVLIDPEGSAKVTDFGIARSLRDDGLTADGRVLGTTDYVSPEQALGHDVDGQSDIYSLGIVLYEMLTGDVPFHGENQISVAMKHVREDIPDIQAVRPEVSATTAAVLDRMTDKDLAHRYADVPSLVADLEDALALEAARQGTSTGEATAVIRTLPAKARRRLPFRMRHSLPVLGIIALAAVAVVIVLLVGNEVPQRVERGTGAGRLEQSTPTGTKVVSVPRGSAHDYDPLGDDEEHSEEVARVVDRDDGTAWSTETYQDGIEGAGKAGVGIYVDAKPKVAAVSMQIDTPAPGFKVTIYAAPAGPVPKSIDEGWTKVGGGTVSSADKRFKLDTGGVEYRYYLVWITKLAPDADNAEISEIRLFQEVAA